MSATPNQPLPITEIKKLAQQLISLDEQIKTLNASKAIIYKATKRSCPRAWCRF